MGNPASLWGETAGINERVEQRMQGVVTGVPPVHGAMGKVRRRKVKKDWKAGLWALLFLGPNLALFFLFTAYPVVYGLYLSFFDYSILTPAEYVGLQNYQDFFRDPLSGKLIRNTIYFTVGAVIPSIVLPLIIAVLLNNARLTGLWRGLYFLPLVTSGVAAAAVWKWLYAKDFGLINYGMRKIGLEPIDWLFSLDWAMPAIIVMMVWLLLPFNIILFTAGLQEIPREYYEAAQIDGASPLRQFLGITVPLITPTTFFVMLTTMLGVLFGGFDTINVMTQGGPLNSTNILIYDIYQNAFQYFRMGYASAQAYLMFLAVFVFTVLNWLLQKRWVHYA
ncbi:MAG TPA: sugar ABC transporter permease [Thermomicrobiales bacterium]|nr:sugar ABC transporter permease [Thermomicrobiales bacterium]